MIQEFMRAARVDFLLLRGASITRFEAAGFGKLHRLQAFAAAGRAVGTRKEEWGTAAHGACVDLAHRSRQGFTPLEIAERLGGALHAF